jgi:hypothetical protein
LPSESKKLSWELWIRQRKNFRFSQLFWVVYVTSEEFLLVPKWECCHQLQLTGPNRKAGG